MTHMSRLFAASLLATLAVAPADAAPGDWPQYGYNARGQRDNVGEHVLDRHTVKRLTRAWVSDINVTHSLPVVANGLVHVGSSDGYLYALDEATGAVAWRVKPVGAVVSAPAVANGIVYAGSNKTLQAYDAAAGTLLWATLMSGTTTGGVVVDKGTIYTNSLDGYDSYVSAFDAATGTLKWSVKQPLTSYAVPAVSGNLVFLTTDHSTVFAYDARTGAMRWSYYGPDNEGNTPAVYKGKVYFNARQKLYALDAKTGAVAWISGTGLTNGSLAVADGKVFLGTEDHVLWNFNSQTGALNNATNIGLPMDATPSYANGVVYIATFLGLLTALDARTAKILWSDTLPGQPDTPLTVADGMLFAADTKLYAYKIAR